MEITILQLLGIVFIIFGGYCFCKGKIEWSFEISPGASSDNTINIDFTPEKFKTRKDGVLKGKWVRPLCAVVFIVGLIFLFIITGETVAIIL